MIKIIKFLNPLKGSCHGIFKGVFSLNNFSLVPLENPKANFKFCQIFRELFKVEINFPVLVSVGVDQKYLNRL